MCVGAQLNILGAAIRPDVPVGAHVTSNTCPVAEDAVRKADTRTCPAVAATVVVALASKVARCPPEPYTTIVTLGTVERNPIGNFTDALTIGCAVGVDEVEAGSAVVNGT